MTNFKTRIATAVAAATVVAAAFTPAAFAATNVVVVGTGAWSVNSVSAHQYKTTNVSQGNMSSAFTGVSVNQNTGKNASAFNVGGSSTVVSGPATSAVTTTAGGGSNTATQSNPCGCAGDTNVMIAGTGAFSYNGVSVVNKSTSNVSQGNSTYAVTEVGTNQNTGMNASAFNVGSGSTVVSGGATSTVTTTVGGGSNTLTQ